MAMAPPPLTSTARGTRSKERVSLLLSRWPTSSVWWSSSFVGMPPWSSSSRSSTVWRTSAGSGWLANAGCRPADLYRSVLKYPLRSSCCNLYGQGAIGPNGRGLGPTDLLFIVLPEKRDRDGPLYEVCKGWCLAQGLPLQCLLVSTVRAPALACPQPLVACPQPLCSSRRFCRSRARWTVATTG